jgi:hypothetical protein
VAAGSVSDVSEIHPAPYCHVSGFPRRIITGSGLDDWI